MVPKHFEQPVHQFFIPSCAGGSGHGRLVRKHVPDSDPGWPGHSNNTAHLVGRVTHLVFPAKAGIQRGGSGGTNDAEPLPATSPIFIPWCAGGSGHGRLVGNHAPYPITGPESREGRGKTAAQCPKNRHAAISKISNLSRDLREVISIPADAGTKQVFSH